ncbi:MAG: hypothetical protein RLT05_22710, partial [Bauldia litoralis]
MRPNPSLLLLAAGLALTASGCASQTSGVCRDADAAMAARNYAGAVPLYGACLAGPTLSPAARADAHHKRGRAHMKAGRHDAALADFAVARRLKPDHAGAHNSAAWVHYLRG